MTTLQYKWKRYLFLLLSVLLLVSLTATYFYYQTNRQKIANEILHHQNTSLKKVLQVYKQDLEQTAKELDISDESYDFKGDKTFLTLDIDGMLFLDSQDKELSSAPKFLTPYLKMLKHSKKTILTDYVKSGKILLLVSLPAQKNNTKGKSKGLLVVYKILSSNDFKTKDAVDVTIVEGTKYAQNSYKFENYETLLLSHCFQGENSYFCIQSRVIAPALKTFYDSTLYAVFLVLFVSLFSIILTYFAVMPKIRKIRILSKKVQGILSDNGVKKLPDFETEEFRNLTNSIQSIVEKLHDDEQMLKFVLDNVPLGIIIYQPHIVYANRYTLKVFNTDMEQLSSYTPDMMLDESMPKTLREEIVKIEDARVHNKDVPPKTYELRLNLNGVVVDGSVIGQSITYKGKPAGILGCFDITETKRTKKELYELFEYLPLIAYKVQIFKDSSFQITVSDAIEKLTGFSKEEVESNPLWWQEQLYEKDKQRVLDAQNQLLENGHLEHQYRLTCKDGFYIWINDQLVNLKKGDKLVDILGFWDDITALKLHETSVNAIAEINQYFLIQNDEEKILSYICRCMVESEFCEQAVLSDSLGKVYSYPKEKIKNFFMQKELELVYENSSLKLDLYFEVRFEQAEVFESIIEMMKKNLEAGLKALSDDKKINQLTYKSSVCDCPNANALYTQLENRKEPFSLVIMNICSFSNINLVYGFEIGNRVLCAVAKIMKEVLRDTDVVYHLSGDTFCALIYMRDMKKLDLITKKIAKACAKNIFVEQRHIPVSCRFGAAKYPDDSHEGLEIKDLAMTALSYGRKYHRKFIVYEKNMKENLSSYVKTEQALLDAIEYKRFEFYYQPVIDAKTLKAVACEALIRLKDEHNKPISPEYMIHVAEELGLIQKITKIVVENVAKQQQIWQEKGLHVKTAINLSSYDVEDENFIAFFEKMLVTYGLTNKSIAVEITERTAVQNYTVAQKFLNHMKEIGISVEIDDFGISHSSLSQITQLEFDTLKIDKSFVDKILSSEKDQEIVKVIIEMAKILGASTLAEGVETKEQYEWLQEQGCDYIQGYYFSKPLCVKDFEAYMLRV